MLALEPVVVVKVVQCLRALPWITLVMFGTSLLIGAVGNFMSSSTCSSVKVSSSSAKSDAFPSVTGNSILLAALLSVSLIYDELVYRFLLLKVLRVVRANLQTM